MMKKTYKEAFMNAVRGMKLDQEEASLIASKNKAFSDAFTHDTTNTAIVIPVSYTHLDVYKRQAKGRLRPGKIVHHTCYLTQENINDPMVSLNFENLEYLCQDCHNEEHHAGASTREDCMFDEEGNLISR